MLHDDDDNDDDDDVRLDTLRCFLVTSNKTSINQRKLKRQPWHDLVRSMHIGIRQLLMETANAAGATDLENRRYIRVDWPAANDVRLATESRDS